VTFHHDPPLTLRHVEARARWLLPAVAVAFTVLALLARFDALRWLRGTLVDLFAGPARWHLES